VTVAGTGRSLKRAITLLVALAIATIVLLALPSLAFGMFAQQPDRSVQTDGRVSDVLVVGDRIYLAGTFLNVNGQSRTRLAAIDANTGDLVPWSPTANNTVRTLKLSPDGTRMYVGGYFNNISGQTRRGLAALDPLTGALSPWNPNPGRPVIDLAASATSVFTAEGGCCPGGEVASYSVATGAGLWSLFGDGDAQTITLLGDKVYVGGHFLVLDGQTRRFFAAADPLTGTLDPLWTPRGSGGGVWALEPDPLLDRMYAGGDFTSINGRSQRGFAQFSG